MNGFYKQEAISENNHLFPYCILPLRTSHRKQDFILKLISGREFWNFANSNFTLSTKQPSKCTCNKEVAAMLKEELILEK